MRKYLIVPALACGLATGVGPAFASDDNNNGTAASHANWMTVAQLTEKLTAEGYDVRDIKAEDNGYELLAIDMNGHRIESHVDPMSGEVLGTDSDD